MLRADEFVLQFRHLLLRAVEHAAEIVPDPLIDIPTGYRGAASGARCATAL